MMMTMTMMISPFPALASPEAAGRFVCRRQPTLVIA